MKKFIFPLERARLWREAQLSLEEMRLKDENVARELLSIDRRALDSAIADAQAILFQDSALAEELATLDTHREYVKGQLKSLAAREVEADRRVDVQRERVIEAKRRFELLDRLKATRMAQWQTQLDRNVDAQAAEAYLSRWNREHVRS